MARTLDDMMLVKVGNRVYIGTELESISTIRWLENKLDAVEYYRNIEAINVLWACKLALSAYEKGKDWKPFLGNFKKHGQFISFVLRDYQSDFIVLPRSMRKT